MSAAWRQESGGRTAGPPRSPLLEGLNEPQREAVEHYEGPLLILAGAGSGKTRVLTHRVAYLIYAYGVRPEEILAITFTNKAAGEMKQRIEQLIGPIARTMWISTFHSMCARILRREAKRLGYKSTFSIYDEDDRRRLIKRCLEELDLDPKRLPPEALVRTISDAKNQLQDAETFKEQVGSFFAQHAARVYELYEKKLMENNAMDFDDLLMKTVNLFELFPDRLAHYQRTFRFVLVDEYQDTNHAQYRLANLLAGEHRNLSVVGDDDQSIYSWRGADIRNILEFERDYPDAKVIRLEQNYRSTQRILDAANAVVRHNRERKGKHLWTAEGEGALVKVVEVNDERAEAQFVASEVQKLLEGEADETPADRLRKAGLFGRDESAASRRTRPRDRAPRRDRRGASRRRLLGRPVRRCLHARPDRRALPHQRPVARDRGGVRPLRHQLPGDRRHEVLRARRDPRPPRLPLGDPEPRRRAAPAAYRQHAAARHRQDHAAAAAGRGGDRWGRPCGT